MIRVSVTGGERQQWSGSLAKEQRRLKNSSIYEIITLQQQQIVIFQPFKITQCNGIMEYDKILNIINNHNLLLVL